GQALLCGELHQFDPNAGWDRVGAAHVSTASAFLRRGYRPPMGTVSGSSGVAFVARRRADPQLAPILPGLDAAIAQDALGTAASIRGRTGISVSTFDQISGLSGVLLCALPHDEQPAAPVAPFVVKALAALALESNGTPAWYTPPEHLYDDEQRHYYPYGTVNLGLAHGIPGPLAALALAAREGVAADEASAAAAVLGEWLAEHATLGEPGPGWDSVVTLAPGQDGLVEVPPRGVGRDAWCYGTPGAARALFLAGDALDRPEWRALAVEAMAAVYRRPPEERGIDSPTFCHGVAGLLQITLRFHHDTRLPLFADAATHLTRQLLDAMEPDRPMGIANLEPGGNKVDQPGMLDGASGVSLALLSAASEVEPTWDRMFALS
ncbi:MAG: lanthionine synthetase C family protein, partial [Actinomycetes bacterium]